MKGKSLRLRLIGGGAVTIVIALLVAGVALSILFERHVTRTVAGDLEVHLNQLLTAIDVDADNKIFLKQPPSDPRFSDPLSGLYWQISARHRVLRSRSLWDTTLALPNDDFHTGEIHQYELTGPAGRRVLVIERHVILTIAGVPQSVRVAVATDLSRIAAARDAFGGDLFVALGLLGLVLAIATTIQVGIGLRPLDALRKGIADIRSGRARHLADQGPHEIRPLVEEVNALLDAREDDVARSRHRAADLAHGLKTPLAALVADGDRLRKKGEISIADDIATAVETMRRHVDRELARVRLRGSRAGCSEPVAPLVRSLVTTMARTPDGARVLYDVRVPDNAVVGFDRADLAEVIGNLIENATRYAKSQVRIGTSTSGHGIDIAVEDDGPGIPPQSRDAALARGMRLDERADGTGLGLAIVQDVLEAYGWTLRLEESDLGGLRARCYPGKRAG